MAEKTILEKKLEERLMNLGPGLRLYKDEIFRVGKIDSGLRGYSQRALNDWVSLQEEKEKKLTKGKTFLASRIQWIIALGRVPLLLRLWERGNLAVEYTFDNNNPHEQGNYEEIVDQIVREGEPKHESVAMKIGRETAFLFSRDTLEDIGLSMTLTMNKEALRKEYGQKSERMYAKARNAIMGIKRPLKYTSSADWQKWELDDADYSPQKIADGLAELVKA